MRLLRWLSVLAAAFPSAAAAWEAPEVARVFSTSVRDLEGRLDDIRNELPALPEIPFGPKGGSLGFHAKTRASNERTRQAWVMVDLEKVRPIEAVVLVAANVVYGAGESRGYGFPTRFRVEVSDDPDFATPLVVADHTQGTIPNPSPAVVLDTGEISGRYVRVTATELWIMEESNRAVFALGELLVFSHGRNVAPGKPVTASDSIEGKPLWSVENLVDGQSSLGHPIAGERSHTNGYHSSIESSPDVAKWVQVDLGATLPIDEVRIFPARPIDWAESHGFGFPERFRVEAAEHGDFSDATVLLERTTVPFPNPGDNPVVIPVDGLPSRYVRFTATQLWRREGDFVFALAEVQVFSGGRNAAFAATVSASDSLTRGFWSKEFLVDGFDSQHRIEDGELAWLRGIARRQLLTGQAEALENRLVEEVGKVTARLTWLATAFGVGLVALIGLVVLRNRALRKRETDRLRGRIAGDLHDEIGSNLGSIALLSEIGGCNDELSEINRIARETVDSMHDIAWVIRSGHDSLDELVLRMREVASAMLRNIKHTFETTPARIPDRRISLDFKRNTLLFLKESLHNLLRHAEASSAGIRIDVTRNTFVMHVIDNGRGFDPGAAETQAGAGLKNMAKRAKSLGGEMAIQSAPGDGTRIQLTAKLF